MLGELNKTLITSKEAQESVKEMKTGKAAGLNGYTTECPKSGGTMVIDGL